MEKISHSCIKCQAVYSDNEIDAYYCSDCDEERKKIAKDIDLKNSLKPKKVKVVDSEIERWKRVGGFMPIIK